jgi:2-methylcitrate dehydratase PrpD
MAQQGAGETAGAERLISAAVAEFVSGMAIAAVPPAAVARARRAFVDTTGVMLAGSRLPAAGIVAEMIRGEDAAPAAGIAGGTLRTSAQLAALANGVAAHGMDYDFSYLMGQPCAGVIPAIYPLAEKFGAGADDMLAAFIIGFEMASRLARANPEHSSVGGFHAVGTIGTIATAAACARLVRAPAAAVPDIIGIAVAMAAGVPVNFGTMTKPLHAGQSARNAVTAAMLGAAGFTASPVALEGRMGYFNAFGRGQPLHPEVFGDLGRRYDLAEHGFTVKGYPCGGLAHTAIDAALEIRDALGPKVAEIAAIKVGITKFASRNIKDVYPHSEESAKFSAPFLTAFSLIHGAPTIDAFTEAAIEDEAVRALAAKVSAFVDTSFGDPLEIPLPARVTVTLANGETIERVKDFAIGSPALPMADARLKAKFMDCATRALDAAQAEALHGALDGLGGARPPDGLWPLLYGEYP